MSEAVTQIVIPVAALVGIGFALFQWFLVSKVRVSGGSRSDDGYRDNLIEGEEEEGIDNDEVVVKCAEIQNAISLGTLSLSLILMFMFEVYMVVFVYDGDH